ncbi:MAG TPA: FecR domain-containing protein [Methylophilus sp.]|nr:FecR domain-containing protein [Methylophilus sp.]
MSAFNAHSRTDQTNILPAVMDELIAWSVKLSSGTASADDEEEFKKWRAKDPMHEAAWQTLHAMEQTLNAVPAASKTLFTQTLALADQQSHRAAKRQSTFNKLGLGAIAFFALSFLVNQLGPWQQQSHFATSMGERATYTLSDGTTLNLNTDTCVDIHYALLKREIVLNNGEIYLETGKDTQALFGRRAFWVNTKQAALEAIGTRFSVYQHENSTRLHVSEGIVAMHTQAHQPIRAYANESYRMQDTASIPLKETLQEQDPMAWLEGVIVAKQMRLDALVTELLRYQSLPVTYDAEIGSLTVSGVFQLNRPDPAEHALQTIGQTLPIRMTKQQDRIVIRKK